LIEYANSVDTISQLRLGKASRERVNFAQLLTIMLFKQVNHPLAISASLSGNMN